MSKTPDFINLGKQAKPNQMYLHEGDKIEVVDKEINFPYLANVTRVNFNSTRGNYNSYELDFHDMYNRHKTIPLDVNINKNYKHTTKTYDELAHEIHDNTKFKINPKHSKVQEKHDRSKYPDYPYKALGQLSTNKNGDYQVFIGKIVDKDLAKKLGTNTVYYEKALRDFTPCAGDKTKHSQMGAMAVYKGSVSGPIALSKNKTVAKMQQSALLKMGNNPKNQDFWLDNNSSLSGSWNLPKNTVMRDSDIHFSNPQNQIVNSWINNSAIKENGNAEVSIVNSNINASDFDVRKPRGNNVPAKLNYENTTLSGTRIRTNTGDHDFYESYLDNAHIGNNVSARNMSLVNLGSTDNPSEIANARLHNFDLTTQNPAIAFDRNIDSANAKDLDPDKKQVTTAIKSPYQTKYPDKTNNEPELD